MKETRRNQEIKKSGGVLGVLERVGNALPDPSILFLILAVSVILLSVLGSMLGWSGEVLRFDSEAGGVISTTTYINSLLSKEGLAEIFGGMVSNFINFAPLGSVLVAILGIGVCEHSGLMAAVMQKLVRSTPKCLVTAMIVFLGVESNLASNLGYVALPPLAALVFLSLGRHPIAGLLAAFAGVSGGFSANLLLSALEPMLGGVTQEAARMLVPDYVVPNTANWYFMIVSTILLVIAGTYVTDRIVEPRLGVYRGDMEEEKVDQERQSRGMRAAGVALLVLIAVLVPVYLSIGGSLFFGNALIPVIMLFFGVPGVAYGVGAGTIKKSKDAVDMMAESYKSMASYMVMCFFAAQFIAYFDYTNIGTIISMQMSRGLQSAHITGIPLAVGFVLLVCVIDLFLGSASAKWAIMAPIFVPMFMTMGYSPEFTQLAYRIGDSCTNIITPLMNWFPMLLVFMQKYNKKASVGTLISSMLPYSIAFLIVWTLQMAIWMIFNLPIGPGSFITFTLS